MRPISQLLLFCQETSMPRPKKFVGKHKWHTRFYLCLATFGWCYFMWQTVYRPSSTNVATPDIAQFHLQVKGVTFDIDHVLGALMRNTRAKVIPSQACQPALVNGSFGSEFADQVATIAAIALRRRLGRKAFGADMDDGLLDRIGAICRKRRRVQSSTNSHGQPDIGQIL